MLQLIMLFYSKGSEDILNGVSSSKMTLYHMELYRDKEHTEAIDFTSSDPHVREAEFDETIYVRAWIDGGKMCIYDCEMMDFVHLD